jgi:hypothetical protein
MNYKNLVLTILALLGFVISTYAQVTVTISAAGPTIFCTGNNVQLSSNIVPASIYQYQWVKNGINIPGENSATKIASETGTYVLRATALNGNVYNSNAISIIVNPLPPAPDLTYNSPAIICNGGSINLSDNSSSNVGYQWYLNNYLISNATNSIYTATAAGNYQLKITDLATGCSSQSQVIVGEAPNIVENVIYSCGTSTTISLTDPNFSYSTLPSQCSIDMSNGNIVNTNIGGNGGSGFTTIICYGGRLTNQGGGNKFVVEYGGTLDYSAGSGSNFVYVKSGGICNIIDYGGGGNIIYYEPGAIISPSGQVDSFQCENIGVIYPNNTQNLCNNLTYLWSNGATTPTITVNPSQPTTYTVTVSIGSFSCSDQVLVIPTANVPTITASGSTSFCQGGSVVLTSSSATGNTWSNGATTQSITVTNNGSFTVSLSNGGCTVTSTPVVVTVNSMPFVSIGVTNSIGLCVGQTVAFSINAINPSTNAPNSPGTTYTLVVSDNPSSPTVLTDIQGTQTIPHTFTTSSCGQPAIGNFPANAFYANVVASNACGTTLSSVSPIVVSSSPIANFEVSSTTVCTNSVLTIDNTGVAGNSISGVNNSAPFACVSNSMFYYTITPSTGWTSSTLGAAGIPSGNWAGITSAAELATVTFTAPGMYTITQKYQNGCGTSTLSQTILVGCDGQTFSIQPLGSQTLCQNATSAPITAVVTGTSDALTYQWYSNSLNNTTSGTLILGATSSSYSPPTASVGTIYYYCVVTSAVSGTAVTSTTSQVQVNTGPTLTTQPTASTVCVAGTTNQMCVTYTNGSGTPTYQWYSNTANSTSGGTAISGATASCYTPPSITAGTKYYYAIINLSGGGCSSIISNTAAVIITPDPVLATQPTATQTICVGGSSAPLTVALQSATGIGTFTYQWYANTTATNSGGTVISGATSPTYNTPVFNIAGTFYYYCVVSDAGNGCGTVTSQVATVVVVADPTISAQPISTQSLCQSAVPTPLAVSTSGGTGTFLYQWYSNVVNNTTSGTLIVSATSATYTPPTATVGTVYYYCVITTAASGCSVTSATATVNVNPGPTFTTQPAATQSVCVGGATTQLNVAYSNGAGAATYQWYSNTTNSYSGGILISAATSSAYTPPSSSAGATYYYCIVSFSAGGGCSMINSNIAQVIVDPSLCGGNTAQAEFSMAAQGCNPVVVAPINTSILNPTCADVTYQWNITPFNSTYAQFVAGTNSSSINPVVQFTLPGNYTVSLTLNSCGTITTVSHQILVETTPAVSITSASSCSPYSYMPGVNVAQAEIVSNSPVTSFSWSVNPNVQVTNSNSANPTIQFNQSGIYTIGLQVSNICGTDTDQAQIEIFGDAISYYQDTDNDSFGNSNIEIVSCVQPAGYVANNLDCNDANASINPSALEIVGNGIDENCDGENTIFSYGILDSTPIVSCSDESVVITVSTEPFGLPNYGLQWYFKTGNIASPAGSSTIGWNMISGATSTTLGVAPFIGTRTYACFVTPDASYGISGEWMVGAKVLTYNSFTAQTIIGNPNITPFNSYNYIVNPISGHTYSWSVTNGAIASGQGTNNVSIMWGQNGPYQLTLNESDGTCSGSSVLFAVNNNCNLTVSAASATTTSFCSGASLQLQAATTATNITYQWYLNGVAIAGETNQNTAATLGGNYQVSITQNGCSAISQVLAITELPGVTTPILVVEQTNAGCSGNDATVSLTDANYNSITWSNGTVNASSINVSESGSYSVTVTDNNGCTATSSAVEINLSLVDVVPICLVTVDQTTGKNNVVWEPVTSDMINSYVVLKETNVANVYAQIGTVAYGSNGLFEDVNSNPQVQANRYKLALIDTCGILSSNSDYHKTIHLTTNLGVGNNVNLIWSGYEGFDFGSYNIYRGASAGTMTLLTTIASNLDSYSDINPPVGEVYYMIEVEGVSCDPQRTLVYSHSNILDTSVGVEEFVSSTISLYPNPATTSINLQVNSTLIGQEYVVFDAIGKVVDKNKIQSTNEIIHLENFNNGNYFVKVNEVVKRFVVQH